MEAELKRLTITDYLTGTLNRRHLNKVGEQELSRARRYRRSLSLIMLDIDEFKEINDRFGHKAGDLALQQTAKTLQDSLRSPDYLGRYGGDEFVMILPETGLKQAIKAAERLRVAVAGQKIVHQSHEIHLSISVGVASVEDGMNSPPMDFDAFTQNADRALYEAKKAGRNCVKVWQS